MDIEFASRRLERCHRDESRATREWGHPVGSKYIERVEILESVDSLYELMLSRSLRLHRLRGNRRGEWALTLHGRWRLVIEPIDDKTVLIKEVSVHYGD